MSRDPEGCHSKAQAFCMEERAWVKRTAEQATQKRGLDGYEDDIAQDVFNKAKEIPDDAWATIQNKKGYIARSVINLANDLCHKHHDFISLTDIILASEPLEAMEAAILIKELYDKVSPADQKLLELMHEGCPGSEIGHILGISNPTARKRISRLLKKLNLLGQGLESKPTAQFSAQLDARIEKH